MSSRIPPFDNAQSEDEKIVESFLSIIQSKLDNKILKPPIGRERKILKDAIFYPGAIIGTLVTIGTFVGMRRAPKAVINYFAKKEFPDKAPLEFKEGRAAQVVGSLLDATFASLLGLTAGTVCTNKQKVLMTAADIPLIEGHSDISNVLCDDFMKLYGTTNKQFWKNHTDDSLVAIQRFVQNCEKRQLYQRKLKREMGLSHEEMESIDVDLPNRVPEDIIQQEKDRIDWASVEDFEVDDEDDNSDDGFWNQK
jgi:hypothetical protein